MNRPVRVAIIDAHSAARRRLIPRLRQISGISVVGEAGDPGEALTMAREQQVDVVLVDTRGMAPGGPEFLARLTRAAPGAGIVIFTAYVTEQECADLKRGGAQAIVLKEIGTGALVRAIRQVAAEVVAVKGRSEA